MSFVFGDSTAQDVLKKDKRRYRFTRFGEDPDEMIKCPICDGRGWVLVIRGGGFDDPENCWACQRKGKVTRERANEICART